MKKGLHRKRHQPQPYRDKLTKITKLHATMKIFLCCDFHSDQIEPNERGNMSENETVGEREIKNVKRERKNVLCC